MEKSGVNLFRERGRLLALVTLVLVAGFVTTSLASYWVSRQEIHRSIVNNALPLTGDTIYSEIQKDMLRPVFISAQMAHDTFLRDWIIAGEQDTSRIERYLAEVRLRNQTVTSFLISEHSRHYYHHQGLLKTVAETDPRDAWFFRARQLKADYEINVDTDYANRNKLTIFINYRVNDYAGRFIGITGVGITLDSMAKLLKSYELRFGRQIYFLNQQGEVVLTGRADQHRGSIRQQAGLSDIAEQILSRNTEPTQLVYRQGSEEIQLNSRFIPELGWYLVVEQNETRLLRPAQRMLLINLLISALVTGVVIAAALYSINRTQRLLEKLASTDALTRVNNRQAFEVLLKQKGLELARQPRPLCGVLLDVDHFKLLNDQHGHQVGDTALRALGQLLREQGRAGDVVARWGGEEFIVLLDDCDLAQAAQWAERLRERVAAAPLGLPVEQSLTISLGVCRWERRETRAAFFSRLDQALYRAKAQGRNRVVVDESAAPDTVAGVLPEDD